jgi:hypothetical protein
MRLARHESGLVIEVWVKLSTIIARRTLNA